MNDSEQRFQYEFVRLGESWFGVRSQARNEYQQVVHDYASRGRGACCAFGAIQGERSC